MPAKKSAAKKAANAKPKTVNTQPKDVETPAPASETAFSASESVASDGGEKAVVAAIVSDKNVLPFIIPLDPGVDSQNQWWERSINGHILRLQRGKRYDLPRYLVDFIESRISIQRLSDESVSVFTNGNGARLNF